jgi:gamma-glutamylcyclotransferase (GGCT)/AIG2-like uncharacterized protein YtfP
MPPAPRHVAFYGSLQAGLHLGGEPPFAAMVRPAGRCRLAGRLYEVADGAYPGLEPSPDHVVHAELYEILDDAVLDLLDEWEDYDQARPERSPYVRMAVRLLEPDLEAWVYVGQHRHRGPWVEAGSWRDHLSGRR